MYTSQLTNKTIKLSFFNMYVLDTYAIISSLTHTDNVMHFSNFYTVTTHTVKTTLEQHVNGVNLSWVMVVRDSITLMVRVWVRVRIRPVSVYRQSPVASLGPSYTHEPSTSPFITFTKPR